MNVKVHLNKRISDIKNWSKYAAAEFEQFGFWAEEFENSQIPKTFSDFYNGGKKRQEEILKLESLNRSDF